MRRARNGTRRPDDNADWTSENADEDLPDWFETDESHLEELRDEVLTRPRTRRDVMHHQEILRRCFLRPFTALGKRMQRQVVGKLHHLEDSLSYADEALESLQRLHVLLWVPAGKDVRSKDAELSQLLGSLELRRTRLADSHWRPADGQDQNYSQNHSHASATAAFSREPHLLGFCVLACRRDPVSGSRFNTIEYFSTLCNGYNFGQLLYQRAGEMCCRGGSAATTHSKVFKPEAEAAAHGPSTSITATFAADVGVTVFAMKSGSKVASAGVAIEPVISGPSADGCRSPIEVGDAEAVGITSVKTSATEESKKAEMAAGQASLGSWPLPSAPKNIYYWMKLERIPVLARGGMLRIYLEMHHQALHGRSRMAIAAGGSERAVNRRRRQMHDGVGGSKQPAARNARGSGRRILPPDEGLPEPEAGVEATTVLAASTLEAFRCFCVKQLHWEPIEVEAYLNDVGGECVARLLLTSQGEATSSASSPGFKQDAAAAALIFSGADMAVASASEVMVPAATRRQPRIQSLLAQRNVRRFASTASISDSLWPSCAVTWSFARCGLGLGLGDCRRGRSWSRCVLQKSCRSFCSYRYIVCSAAGGYSCRVGSLRQPSLGDVIRLMPHVLALRGGAGSSCSSYSDCNMVRSNAPRLLRRAPSLPSVTRGSGLTFVTFRGSAGWRYCL